MSAPDRTVYTFAVLRAVPHVYLGTFHNVGIVLHAPAEEYLGIRVLNDPEVLHRRIPDADAELLARYLTACQAVCNGEEDAGPIAMASASERFHWLTSPRSDVLQASAVHEGMGSPQRALDELFTALVG